MNAPRYCTIGLLLLELNASMAGKAVVIDTKDVTDKPIYPVLNPIEQRISSGSLPARTTTGLPYSVTYTFKSNLPFKMPTPFNNTQSFLSDQSEFAITDNCNNQALQPGGECSIIVNFISTKRGFKSATVNLNFGNNQIPVKFTSTTGMGSGIIGINYAPNHYPVNIPTTTNSFNNHDVFYTGGGSSPISNIGAELSQLKAAGFSTVRAYATTAYTWIDIINRAAALNMNVVYEVTIPQGGSCNPLLQPSNSSTTTGQGIQVLNSVISQVSPAKFKQTVTLVFAGHENYDGTALGATYLECAITQIQKDLKNLGVNSGTSSDIPVTTAFRADDVVNPVPSQSIVQGILTTGFPAAPISFDTYPVQWGVPYANAVTDVSTTNSVAWDYSQIANQNYTPTPPFSLIAETGWVTNAAATNPPPPDQYACGTGSYPPCDFGLTPQATTYLQAIYTFINTPSNKSSALVFEAYDEPAKALPTTSAENYYGVFDSNCNLKGPNNLGLIPNQSFSPDNNLGCQGFTSGALIPVSIYTGTQTAPFTVQITQRNPTTSQDASMTVVVPVQDRTNIATPWPYFVIYNNAQLIITGSATGQTCTTTATVVAGTPTFTSAAPCNCTYQGCFLPNPF